MASTKRKTRESFGAIRKLPSGRYQASYLGADGRRHTAPRTFDAMIDARAWLFDRRKELDSDTWEPPAIVARRAEPFGDYATAWIEHRRVKGAPLRPRTREEYKRLLAGPLESFATTPLSRISRDDIETWHREHSARRPTQTSRAYALLKAVLSDAVDRGYLPTSPARLRGGASAKTGRVVEPPTVEEVAAIREALPARLRALVTVAAEGGLRYGEATELRRRDVTRRESGAATIRVERGVVWTRDGAIVGPPKSAAGSRSVTLPPTASAELFAHLDGHVDTHPDALIFPTPDGDHMPMYRFAPDWRRARAAAGRDDLGFHALRHFHLTAFARRPGATLAAIMARAGHSTVVAAMTYQHAAAELDAEIAEQMG